MTVGPGSRSGVTAYTPATMDAGTLGGRRGPGVDALYAEAESLLGRSANELRGITERLRQSYAGVGGAVDLEGTGGALDGAHDGLDPIAEAARIRSLLSRLEITTRDLEDSWRFLERGMTGEWSDSGRAFVDQPGFQEAEGSRIAKRILEAQEGERARLAEEIHDGPAQALANASFQVEIIGRMLDRDPDAARQELAARRRTMVSKVSEDHMTLWVKLAGTVGVEELAASSKTRTRASARRWAGVRARWASQVSSPWMALAASQSARYSAWM